MRDCKVASTPGVVETGSKATVEQEELEKQELKGKRVTKFRKAVATLNYVSQDRVDIAYATKEVARRMAKPTEADEIKLKRLLRYLRGVPRAGILYRWQDAGKSLTAQVDSDWASCSRTRRSTSGGLLLRGKHVLSAWSRTQATVALSSGEAELNGALKGAAELLGASALLVEAGKEVVLGIEGDSSACEGIVHREGSGRLKHLEVRQLWIQNYIKDGRMTFTKIPRLINGADTLAKYWSAEARGHFHRIGFMAF